ncbi:MarR family winged helix-turn-helix transcriptional regulator [Microbacterium sp. NPDC058389]|uniref:MarR family winged helix-turn-helix transcriptional regulator n=1 Tax=Microbacterium sp. NPDC058389 TaxID=3346475 RepID=UPI00364684F3
MDDMNLNEENDTPPPARPLGYWLRAVDGLLTRAFAEALDAEGVSRRDWMLLNVVSGDVDAPGLAERLARKGKRLRSLQDRGWVLEKGDGTWELTDLGRAEKERIGAIVDGIRSRVTGAVGDDAYTQLTTSLEAIARELGWDETTAAERGFGRPGFGRPGFGRPPFGVPGFGPDFGPGFGFGGRPRPFEPEIRDGFGPNRHRGFGPGRPGRPAERGDEQMRGRGHGPQPGCDEGRDHPHGGHGHHDHPHYGGHGRGQGGGRRAQEAYERGFDAGFARGREDRDA